MRTPMLVVSRKIVSSNRSVLAASVRTDSRMAGLPFFMMIGVK